MKKLLSLLILSLSLGVATAQVQQGYIRSINRPNRQPQPVPNVVVNIGGLTNNVRTDAQGLFAFPVTGQSYRIMRIQKQGYQLIDKGVVGRQYPFSSTVRQEIVMVSLADLQADRQRIEERAYQRAQADYNRRLAEIQQQLQAQLITQQEAAQQELALGDNFQKFIDMIGDMAERYATMDYEGISDINRQIFQCIENAELERADSLINSKGSTQQREEELQQSRELAEAAQQLSQQAQRDYQFKLQDLAEDYYNKYTIFASQYQNDSAAYFLERRANLDTTNVEWSNSAAIFIMKYLSDYDKAWNYLSREERFVQSIAGEESEQMAIVLLNKGHLFILQGKPDDAIDCFARAYRIFHSIDGAYSLMVNCLDHLADGYVQKGEYNQALDFQLQALNLAEESLDSLDNDLIRIYLNAGVIFQRKANNEQALGYYHKALSIAERTNDTYYLAGIYNSIASSYEDMDRFQEAIEYYQKALELRKQQYGERHRNVALVYNNLASSHSRLSHYELALSYYQKAIEIYLQAVGEQHPDVATIYSNMARIFHASGKRREGFEYDMKALAIRRVVLSENHPDLGISYTNIGAFYNEMQQADNAIEYLQKALVIFEAAFGINSIQAGKACNHLGNTYYIKGEYQKSLEYCLNALERVKSALGEEHSEVANIYLSIGKTYGALKDYDKEIQYEERALRIFLNVYNSPNANTSKAFRNLGYAYYVKKDYSKALDYYQKALQMDIVIYGEDSPQLASIYNNIGNCYKDAGMFDLAIEALQKSLTFVIAIYGEEHPNTAIVYNSLGTAIRDNGDISHGMEYIEKCYNIMRSRFGDDHPNTKRALESVEKTRAMQATPAGQP